MTILLPPQPRRPHVKICGIRRVEDGLLALQLGASYLGLILTRKSSRFIAQEEAATLLAALRGQAPALQVIGVFVDEPPAEMAGALERLSLTALQVHGPTEAISALVGVERVIPAVAIRDEAEANRLLHMPGEHPAVLADSFSPNAHGGTGKVFNHALVQPVIAQRPLFIAGGLGPGNIASIVGALGNGQPYAYDLNSGVEASPGVKSRDLLESFFSTYHKCFPGPDAPR